FVDDPVHTLMYTLSLHDALPIYPGAEPGSHADFVFPVAPDGDRGAQAAMVPELAAASVRLHGAQCQPQHPVLQDSTQPRGGNGHADGTLAPGHEPAGAGIVIVVSRSTPPDWTEPCTRALVSFIRVMQSSRWSAGRRSQRSFRLRNSAWSEGCVRASWRAAWAAAPASFRQACTSMPGVLWQRATSC